MTDFVGPISGKLHTRYHETTGSRRLVQLHVALAQKERFEVEITLKSPIQAGETKRGTSWCLGVHTFRYVYLRRDSILVGQRED